jgi:hypothetical protein
MADRYWVGGTGTWNTSSTTNWSASTGGPNGASVPTSADNVFFDINSNTATNNFTVSLSGALNCANFDTTGIDPFTSMALTGSGTIAVAGTVFTFTNKVLCSNTGTLTFSGNPTITTAGVPFSCSITVSNGATLADSLFLDSVTVATFTLTGGTLALGANNITCRIFASTGAVVRAITTSTGTITATGLTVTALNLSGSNATYQSGLTVNLTGVVSSGSTRTVVMSGGTTVVNLSVSAGAGTLAISGITAVNNFDLTGFSGTIDYNAAVTVNIYGSLTIPAGCATAVTSTGAISFRGAGTITTNGVALNSAASVNATGTYTLADNLQIGDNALRGAFTLTAGTLALGANNLTVLTFSSTGATARSITRTTGNIYVWATNTTIVTSTGSNVTYTAGLTFISSRTNTTTSFTRTFNITTNNNVSIAAGSNIVTFSGSNSIGDLDFTGSSGSWSNVTLSLAGLTLSTGMTVTAGASTVTFARTGTITSNGKTLDFPVTINGSGITTTLGDDLSVGATRTLLLNQGTLNFNDKNASIGTFSSGVSNVRTIAIGSGTITVSAAGSSWNTSTTTNLTVTGTGTISMTAATAKTFLGGGASYSGITLNQGGAGALTISGNNTFANITNTVQPTTITFTASSTQTVSNFTVSGTAGNLVTINSTAAGTRANLSKTSGTVDVSYCSIRDSNATGGATWNAFTSNGNVDVSNNLGWIFGAALSTGNFFLLF